ncbi:MAG: hypothetical protein SOW59_00460 [Corynebacterium sp.]|nr:hypothetical protein [Corynebacterium sp.]
MSKPSQPAERRDGDLQPERIGFTDIQPFNTDPTYDPREGLWDPERGAKPTPTPVVRRTRALPKSHVRLTLRIMLLLIIIAAVVGLLL